MNESPKLTKVNVIKTVITGHDYEFIFINYIRTFTTKFSEQSQISS